MSETSLHSPAPIEDFREACMRSVKEAIGVELDGTQDTLPILDHYLGDIPSSARSELLSLVVPMCGAYFGEVIRNHLTGARWYAPGDDFSIWRMEFDGCFLAFNPLGMVLERISMQEESGWNAHLHLLDKDRPVVDAALDVLGDVRPEDYFRLGTRFEVIETAYLALTSRAKPGDSFGPSVYIAASPNTEDDGRL